MGWLINPCSLPREESNRMANCLAATAIRCFRLVRRDFGGDAAWTRASEAGSFCELMDNGGSMPAKSKKQQMAAGAALAAKRGKRSKASLKGASREMVESMSEQQLRDFAKTKRKRLPRKKKQD
jgi:hypothetical protein